MQGRPRVGKTTTLIELIETTRAQLEGILWLGSSIKELALLSPHIPHTSMIYVTDRPDVTLPMPNPMRWPDVEHYLKNVWIPAILSLNAERVRQDLVPHTFALVLDDIASDATIYTSAFMHQLYRYHAEWNVVLYVVCQDQNEQIPLSALPYVTTFVMFNNHNAHVLYPTHRALFPFMPYDDFVNVLHKATEPPYDAPTRQGCLILDTTHYIPKDDPWAGLYWFRADVKTATEEWRVGNYHYFNTDSALRPTLPPPPCIVSPSH
jgi:hypothetical protein